MNFENLEENKRSGVNAKELDEKINELLVNGVFDPDTLKALIAERKALRMGDVSEPVVNLEEDVAEAELGEDRASTVRNEITRMVASGDYDYQKLEKLLDELKNLREEEVSA